MNEEVIAQYFKSLEKRFDTVDDSNKDIIRRLGVLETDKLIIDTKKKTVIMMVGRTAMAVSSVVGIFWAVVADVLIPIIHKSP